MSKTGKFVISLDFEMLWGAEVPAVVEAFAPLVRGVHSAIPQMLTLFERYQVSASFCTVGFILFESKADLLAHLPERIPQFENPQHSAYTGRIDRITKELEDCYFAPHLVKQILQSPRQELGTHTLSHFYGLERGQTREDFRADLIAAQKVAERFGARYQSMVFPKNQVNPDYLSVLTELGIKAYRGNERSWLYRPGEERDETLLRRALRLLDSYICLTGQHCYRDDELKAGEHFNFPSSRFLRPYSARLEKFEGLRLRRITQAMKYAAKNGLTYHLWWHPYNFGQQQSENFSFLEKILQQYQLLHKEFGMESFHMSGLAQHLEQAR